MPMTDQTITKELNSNCCANATAKQALLGKCQWTLNNYKENTMYFKQLPPPLQKIFSIFTENGYGYIENLKVANGLPVLDGNLRVVKTSNFHKKPDSKKYQPKSDDFTLKELHKRFMQVLQQLENGLIAHIDFQDGLPRNYKIEKKY